MSQKRVDPKFSKTSGGSWKYFVLLCKKFHGVKYPTGKNIFSLEKKPHGQNN